MSFHIQLLFGLYIDCVSPKVNVAVEGFMKNAMFRCYNVEHITRMLIGILLITIGYSKAIRKTEDAAKRKTIKTFYIIGLKSSPKSYTLSNDTVEEKEIVPSSKMELLDHYKWFAWALGGSISLYSLYVGFTNITLGEYGFVNLNYINFLLLGLCITFHGSIFSFINACTQAVIGATGIIIQFPLYAVIMVIMKYSRLLVIFSDFFIQISTPFTFP